MNAFAPNPTDAQAWNEAHARLTHFVDTFAIGDRAYASRLVLKLLDEARHSYESDKSRSPTTVAMERAQQSLAQWLATSLGEQSKSPSELLASGYIALLLSRIHRDAPTSFLVSPLPEDLRQLMRQTLLETGPDLNISSMTPRHLDFGPMLNLAQQTWHRFGFKEVVTAVLFWAGVYYIFYWWLSQMP